MSKSNHYTNNNNNNKNRHTYFIINRMDFDIYIFCIKTTTQPTIQYNKVEISSEYKIL